MWLQRSPIKAREMGMCQLLLSLMKQNTCKQLNGRGAIFGSGFSSIQHSMAQGQASYCAMKTPGAQGEAHREGC